MAEVERIYAILGVIGIVVGIVGSVLLVICWMLICSKAGYSKWLGLLMIVPIVNLIWFLIFAFSKWPTLTGQQRVSQAPATTRHYQTEARATKETVLANCPKCGMPFAAKDKFCGSCGFLRQE